MRKNQDADEDWQTGLVTYGDPRMSQGLEIGLVVLQTFTPDPVLKGIADIAEETKLSRPTTHRYVKTFQALGLVEQGAQRKYRLAQDARNVGTAMLRATRLQSVSLPFLRDLREQVGYTVSLAILDRDCVLYAARLYSHGRGQYTADEGRCVGSRVPASCTAMGKALVAGLPKSDEHDWTRDTTLNPCGPNAIVKRNEFRAELERVRQLGYAVNDRELVPGMVAIAAPVQKGDDVSAAIGIAANAYTTQPAALVERCRDALLATASELAEHLSYNPRMVWRNT